MEELTPIREAERNLEFAVFGGGCFWCIEAVFSEAEESHQAYFARNPEKQYCQAVISPKILKMRKLFAERLKSPPA